MDMNKILHIGIPSLILLAALFDDLKTRKIHNKLVLICFAIASISVFVFHGIDGLKIGFIASAMALALTLPLVLVKALGAGDMKIMLAFGMASEWQIVFWVIIYSMIWGALLGIIKSLLNKNASNMFRNTFLIATQKLSPNDSGMTKIPFSVALLFGWLSQLSLNSGAGAFLSW